MSPTFPRIARDTLSLSESHVQVLAVGPWQQQEFATALEGCSESAAWPRLESMDASFEYFEESTDPPELVLLAQLYPGQITQEDVQRIQQRAPLARIVVVAGTWCEGEMRTGSPPLGVLRLYWYEFPSWWREAVRFLREDQCPPWSVPLDSPQAGRFSVNDSQRQLNGTVAVCAQDFSVVETIESFLGDQGLDCEWVQEVCDWNPEGKFRAALWDGGQLSDKEYRQLKEISAKLADQQCPLVALLDFPRVEHIRRLKRLGITNVLAKPYVVDEVLAALTQSF